MDAAINKIMTAKRLSLGSNSHRDTTARPNTVKLKYPNQASGDPNNLPKWYRGIASSICTDENLSIGFAPFTRLSRSRYRA